MASREGETVDAVLRIIREHFPKLKVARATDRLYERGLDSLATFKLVAALEKEVGVRIPDEALTRENFRTPGSIAAVIDRCSKNSATRK